MRVYLFTLINKSCVKKGRNDQVTEQTSRELQAGRRMCVSTMHTYYKRGYLYLTCSSSTPRASLAKTRSSRAIKLGSRRNAPTCDHGAKIAQTAVNKSTTEAIFGEPNQVKAAIFDFLVQFNTGCQYLLRQVILLECMHCLILLSWSFCIAK